MDPPETAELDESRITSESRSFAAALFARFPELRQYASMERLRGEESWALLVTVPALSGDPRSGLVVWVDDGDDPSVEFGAWHTHETLWGTDDGSERSKLLDLIAGILADQFVLCEDIGGMGGGSARLLDLSDPDSLLEELTNKYSTGRARLRSWSGRFDREVALEDLEGNDSKVGLSNPGS